jgi:PAS domain S-box-containing protein
MTPILPIDLSLFAQEAAVSSFWRLLPQFLGGGVAILVLVIVEVYIRRLNIRHRRLLGDLNTELAERLKAEEAKKASEGFYHSLVESLPAGILRKDLEGRFTFGNDRFCQALAVDRESGLVGKTDLDFFPTELAEKYRADDRRVIDTDSIFEGVEEHVTRSGERLYVQVIKTPLHDAQGRVLGVQGIFWDVTARKRAEEQLLLQNIRLQEMAESERTAHADLKQAQSQLVQSEKLASLGLIVAGVAHEINNPVAFVTNNVAVLGRDVGEMRDLIAFYEQADDLITRERADLFEKIQTFRDRVDMAYTLENMEGLLHRSRDGLKRIQQIVTHLRLFAHLDEGDVNDADLNDGIESTAAILVGHARKKSIAMQMDLNPLPPVTCNAARVNQVVMNLLTNAIDACDEGGNVTVRTAFDAETEIVRIEVADTGCGIDPAVRDRIFDPFFTTKPIGQGTGLGLSISYGIVKEHTGTIEVDSTPGKGTRFVVRLPLRPAPKKTSKGAPEVETKLPEAKVVV